VNDKTNMRYTGFRSAGDGGRIFDFLVSATAEVTVVISIEIPNELFVGADRIQLQEGAGISYAKLKHLLTVETADDIPRLLHLTASDLALYRQAPAQSKRRWGYGANSADTNKTAS
jgi:hypothetical protein